MDRLLVDQQPAATGVTVIHGHVNYINFALPLGVRWLSEECNFESHPDMDVSKDGDDAPVETSFKHFKKKILHLSENLKSVYQDGIQSLKRKQKRRNDPRFDPRVNGICHVDDWEFLEDERKQTLTVCHKFCFICNILIVWSLYFFSNKYTFS
ncbi:unnamed protein product [Heterobilharzia americana]|nr:unnamed protein product [Heterobilharzia americana]